MGISLGPLPILLLQMIIIIVVGRVVGSLIIKFKQPRVVGEIAGGIILGPSLFGLFFPELFIQIFPKESLPALQLLSQLGLILFMFVVGMEVELQYLKKMGRSVIIISQASIIVPFIIGVGIAWALAEQFMPQGASPVGFALFMGISMSITAFPVLARILKERGLVKDPVGAIALSCAAVNDVSAWFLLALVLAISQATSILGALYIFLFAAIYMVTMVVVVRPILARAPAGKLGTTALYLTVLLISSFATELIGIHALFGAFIAGLIIPKDVETRELLTTKIEDVSLLLLLPLFFAFTGLNTEIGSLSSPSLWVICFLIIIAAVIGKLGGSVVASRMSGLSWRKSYEIGVLMNTRGLMELVILNIGLEAGLLNKELFTMFVIMALVTTAMTGILLDLSRRQKTKSP